MTSQDFIKIINYHKKHTERYNRLYSLGIDINEIYESLELIQDILFKQIYTEEGLEWLYWFIYDNEYGTKGLEAFDENKNPICYSELSTWAYLEEHFKINK